MKVEKNIINQTIQELNTINNIHILKPFKIKKSINELIKLLENKIKSEEVKEVKKLAFFHIPKTAGGTITNILNELVHPDEIYNFRAKPSYSYYIDEFENYKLKKSLIIGHYSYKIVEEFPEEIEIFTVIREPIQRILSLYEYAKRTKNHYLYKIINDNNYTIEDCINNKVSIEFDNNMVRLFAGIDHHFDEIGDNSRIIKYGNVNKKLLDRALVNIQSKFIHIGFQDELDKTLDFITNFYQKEIPSFKSKNINTNSHYESRYSIETIEFLKEQNSYDLILYDKLKSNEEKVI